MLHSCTVAYCDGIYRGYDPEAALICGLYRLDKILNRALLNQIDRAAAETAARHPRSVNAVQLLRGLRKEIKLLAGNRIVIAKRRVRSVHQLTKAAQITCFQSRYRFKHTSVFIHRMPRTSAANIIRNQVLSLLEFRCRQCAERRRTQLLARCFTLAPAVVIGGGCERMPHAAVNDHQSRVPKRCVLKG